MTSGAEGVQASYFNASITITLGGTRLDSTAMADLIGWDVDTTVGRPDSAVVRFHIPMDSQGTAKEIPATWKPGAALKIEAAKVQVFEGELTSLELNGGVDGLTEVVLNAFDKRHRLYRHETVKLLKDVTASDIISAVIKDTGVSAGSHSGLPTTVYKHHFHQGTAGDYLDRLCHEFGLWCLSAPGGKVEVKAAKDLSTLDATVTYGIEIEEFRFRQTTSGDRTKVQVRGWDPKAKKEILGEGARSAGLPNGVLEGPSAQTAFNATAEVRHEAWVPAQSDAEKAAVGVLSQNLDAGMQLDATLTFNPKIKAGSVIEVKGVTGRFNGKYRVSASRHTYSSDDGNRTVVTCRGSDDVTVTGLLESAVSSSVSTSRGRDDRIDGVHVGLVTKVKSVVDEGAIGGDGAAGEVRVKLPWLDDQYESQWLRVVTVGGGKDRGFFVMPEVDDEVLVAFEGGDPRRGYVLGGLYNGKDAAPRKADKLTDGSTIHERVWKSRKGHEIAMGDKDGEEFVMMKTKDNTYLIVIDLKEKSIRIESDGAVSITAEKDLSLEAKGGITIKAAKDVAIEGQNVKIDGKQNVDVKATTNATVEGTAGAAVKGAKVDITSQGPATVKGNPIMLN